MSTISAAQASAFYEQVALNGVVFTFKNADEYLMFRVGGKEVVPFWSSRSRLEDIKEAHPKYAGYLISEETLQEFLDETLPLMEGEAIHIGVNWSGAGLKGYDVEARSVRQNIEYWLSRKSGNG